MSLALRDKLLVSLYIVGFILVCVPSIPGDKIDSKVLNVGKELYRETLPLKMGSRLYQLQGLKPYVWYEVKISYPASIPAIFSLQLKKGNFNVELNMHRKLLNTEKLIFKTQSIYAINNQGGMYVLVTVEPEGIVAIPGVQEREFVLFNIVCDELLLGIPYKAWAVVGLALLCLGLAFMAPSFLPSYLLQKDETDQEVDKNS
ncbi:hypothetical protein Nepgr_008802 [Nepenthes gracilis]|uniref:Uncharacterized protein n=1 Tax=Nepenthes gracilis TaxID=150966 RepID=A0AAD3SA47_NEPGR|nr:hypothetical protein Nepgr_008802 [Nepenthes gracilis]